MQEIHKFRFRLSKEQYSHLISLHLHLIIESSYGSLKVPFSQDGKQFPKYKYCLFLQELQLEFSIVSFLSHVLQSEWHLSIVFKLVSFKKYPSGKLSRHSV